MVGLTWLLCLTKPRVYRWFMDLVPPPLGILSPSSHLMRLPIPAATPYTLPIIPTEPSLNLHYKATPTPLAPVVPDSVPRWCAIPTHRQLTAR